jgi:hypothetical protein
MNGMEMWHALDATFKVAHATAAESGALGKRFLGESGGQTMTVQERRKCP